MEQERALTRAGLKTPRAAAVAGIVFSLLLIVSLVLTRRSVPVVSLHILVTSLKTGALSDT